MNSFLLTRNWARAEAGAGVGSVMTAGDAIGRTSLGNGGSRRGGGNSLQDDAETSADLAKRSGAGRANAFAMVSALTRVWAPAIVIGKPWLRKTNSGYFAMLLAYLPDPFSCSGEATASRSAVGTRSPSAAGVGNVCVNSAGHGDDPRCPLA
jgi:hypothetical protein